MNSNPFEELAQHASRPTRIKMARAPSPPIIPTPREKEQYDRQKQYRLFLKWKAEIRQGLIDGKYGMEIVQLLKLLRTIPDPNRVLEFVRNATWLRQADVEVRYNALTYIDYSLMRWNVRHGLPVWTDNLFDEPDCPFIAIRKLLTAKSEL